MKKWEYLCHRYYSNICNSLGFSIRWFLHDIRSTSVFANFWTLFARLQYSLIFALYSFDFSIHWFLHYIRSASVIANLCIIFARLQYSLIFALYSLGFSIRWFLHYIRSASVIANFCSRVIRWNHSRYKDSINKTIFHISL